MALNAKQFPEYQEVEHPDSYWSHQPDAALKDEHEWAYPMLVDQYRRHNPEVRDWPGYSGHGSSLLAHEGITARGRLHELNKVETEMARRGMPTPDHGLHSLHSDVPSVDTFDTKGR